MSGVSGRQAGSSLQSIRGVSGLGKRTKAAGYISLGTMAITDSRAESCSSAVHENAGARRNMPCYTIMSIERESLKHGESQSIVLEAIV